MWLKPAFHSELTGKLSDVAVCFVMPLFLSELLGIAFRWPAARRLWAGAIATASIFTALEVVPPVTGLALVWLSAVGPYLGISGRFQMTRDWTDLFCLLLIPLAVAYGKARLTGDVAGLHLWAWRDSNPLPPASEAGTLSK